MKRVYQFIAFSTIFSGALHAATPIYTQSFDSLTSITNDGGTCTNCTFPSGKQGQGVYFPKSGNQLLTLPVPSGFNKLKGTISFFYKPSLQAGNDWGTTSPALKTLFKFGGTSNLRVGTYYDSTVNKNFLFFRHDRTENCPLLSNGNPNCQREISTSPVEPSNTNPTLTGVIAQWNTEAWHRISVSWDYTGSTHYLGMQIDDKFQSTNSPPTPVDLDTFASSNIYIGTDTGGNYDAQGTIDDFKIYDEALVKPGAEAFIELINNDGYWHPNETVHNSTDAPTPVNIGSNTFIVYPSKRFARVFDGSLPPVNIDAASIDIEVARNETETAFFNVYAGTANLGVTEVSISDLTNGTHVLDQDAIKIRTVKNWWQAGTTPYMGLPTYVPELLIYDDTVEIKCSGSMVDNGDSDNIPNPCNGKTKWPSDPKTEFTKTQILSSTSKQFALTVVVPAGAEPGVYTGEISVVTQFGGTKTISVNFEVKKVVLPEIDKIIGLYHESRYDIGDTSDVYVDTDIYAAQLKNMKEHGVNGAIMYGQLSSYPQALFNSGLTKFGAFINWGGFNSSAKFTPDVSNSSLAQWLDNYGYEPYLYGVDEPDYQADGIAKHLDKSQVIHAATVTGNYSGAKVTAAITKNSANTLTDSLLFPKTFFSETYSFAEGKLDLPILAADYANPTSANYFNGMLDGTLQHDSNPELYYWQVYQEDPRINRFYTGYHLWLTDLAGTMAYVLQKVRNDAYNDFDGVNPTTNRERDLNAVYPSQQGGIDTVQWEAFREGVDDYRMLQLWKILHAQIALVNFAEAESRKVTIENLLLKYRDMHAFKVVTIEQFADDRETILNEISEMQEYVDDLDGDGIDNVVDNCPSVANADQLNNEGDGEGDVCDADDDNDTVADVSDAFVLNVAASADLDGDGHPENFNPSCDTACQSNSGLMADNDGYTKNGTAFADTLFAPFNDETGVAFYTINGLDGDDVIAGDTGNDFINGGDGSDTVNYSGMNSAVNVNLHTGVISGGGGSDTLNSVENIIGTDHNDWLKGKDGEANVLDGGVGDDIISCTTGGDTISFTSATAGVTYSLYGTGTAQVTGGAGTDTHNLGSPSYVNCTNLRGSAYSDTLTGTNSANVFDAGAGNDVINASGGDDTLIGGVGDDILNGEFGNDTYYVDSTNDVITEPQYGNADTVYASATYTLSNYVESLTLTGTSSLNGTGNGSANTLVGNSAANTLSGMNGADSLTGGTGVDIFKYSATGEISANGGGSNDAITDFEVGIDKIDVSAIDANSSVANDQTFNWVTSFSTARGEVKYDQSTGVLLFKLGTGTSGEYKIQLPSGTALTSSDLVL